VVPTPKPRRANKAYSDNLITGQTGPKQMWEVPVLGLGCVCEVFAVGLLCVSEVFAEDSLAPMRSSAARAAHRGASPLPHLFRANRSWAITWSALLVRRGFSVVTTVAAHDSRHAPRQVPILSQA